MRGSIAPISLPAILSEVETYSNVVQLAVAIGVVDAQPTEALCSARLSLVVGRSRHDLKICQELI